MDATPHANVTAITSIPQNSLSTHHPPDGGSATPCQAPQTACAKIQQRGPVRRIDLRLPARPISPQRPDRLAVLISPGNPALGILPRALFASSLALTLHRCAVQGHLRCSGALLRASSAAHAMRYYASR